MITDICITVAQSYFVNSNKVKDFKLPVYDTKGMILEKPFIVALGLFWAFSAKQTAHITSS